MNSKNNLFVIGIGGTGSRVLKSICLLLASGCNFKGFRSVIPIIIDPDKDNGDVNRTTKLFNLYRKIRRNIDDPKFFFRQDIQSLNSLKQSDDSSSLESKSRSISDFRFPLEEVDSTTYQEYIDFHSLSDDYENSADDKNFVRLFFSEENLVSTLKVGFKGNPNMGTVVLNQISSSKEFKKFGESFNEGDAIFIINSIFGGTGAAGLPLILKNIKENKEIPGHAKLKNAKVGAITYLPYFAVDKKDSNVEINSESFEEKAKVALTYYDKTIIGQNELDCIYFIGNKRKGQHYDYSVGGKSQENKANFLELAGALAVMDFCENVEKSDTTQVKEFGLAKDYSHSIKYSNLNPKNRLDIEVPLSKFKVFTDYLISNDGLKKALGVSRWTLDQIPSTGKYTDSNLTKKFFESSNFDQISEFLWLFSQWLKEMQLNDPPFSPYPDTNRDDALTILGKGPKGYRLIDRENNRLIKKREIRNHRESKINTSLFRLFENSINKFTDKNLAK